MVIDKGIVQLNCRFQDINNTIKNTNEIPSSNTKQRLLNHRVILSTVKMDKYRKLLCKRQLKVSLKKLKCKDVMSAAYRRKHCLKHSNLALICRQLMNAERRYRMIAKRKKQKIEDDQLLTSLPVKQNASTIAKKTADNNETFIQLQEQNGDASELYLDTSMISIEDKGDSSNVGTSQKELSSISIKTSSGLHSIATRAVKISRRLSTRRHSSKSDLVDECRLKVRTPTKTYKSSHAGHCLQKGPHDSSASPIHDHMVTEDHDEWSWSSTNMEIDTTKTTTAEFPPIANVHMLNGEETVSIADATLIKSTKPLCSPKKNTSLKSDDTISPHPTNEFPPIANAHSLQGREIESNADASLTKTTKPSFSPEKSTSLKPNDKIILHSTTEFPHITNVHSLRGKEWESNADDTLTKTTKPLFSREKPTSLKPNDTILPHPTTESPPTNVHSLQVKESESNEGDTLTKTTKPSFSPENTTLLKSNDTILPHRTTEFPPTTNAHSLQVKESESNAGDALTKTTKPSFSRDKPTSLKPNDTILPHPTTEFPPITKVHSLQVKESESNAGNTLTKTTKPSFSPENPTLLKPNDTILPHRTTEFPSTTNAHSLQVKESESNAADTLTKTTTPSFNPEKPTSLKPNDTILPHPTTEFPPITNVHSLQEKESKSNTDDTLTKTTKPSLSPEKPTSLNSDDNILPQPPLPPNDVTNLNKISADETVEDDCMIIDMVNPVSAVTIPCINLENDSKNSTQLNVNMASKPTDIPVEAILGLPNDVNDPFVLSETCIPQIGSPLNIIPEASVSHSPLNDGCLIIERVESVAGLKTPCKTGHRSILSEVRLRPETDTVRMKPPKNIVPEPDFLNTPDIEDLIIEKVESISAENAEALINDADMHWDNDILPANFLQCDMEVNESESGINIYKDSKLLMKPTVVIKKLTSRDFTRQFVLKNRLSYWTAAHCTELMKTVEKARCKKQRSILRRELQSYRMSMKDQPTSLVSLSKMSSNASVGNLPSVMESIPNKTRDLESAVSKNYSATKPTKLMNELRKGLPIHSSHIAAINDNYEATLQSTAMSCQPSPPKNLSPSKFVFIRPKPLSLLMEPENNEITSELRQTETASSKESWVQPPTVRPIAAMPVQSAHLMGNQVAPIDLNGHLDRPAISSQPVEPVNTYSLTHSIFGPLVDKDKVSGTKGVEETLIVRPHASPLGLPPPYQQHQNFVQPPLVSPQFIPGHATPLYTRPVVAVNPAYAPAVNKPPPPGFAMRAPIFFPSGGSDVAPPSSSSLDCERPMVLLQQPFIPVLGGGIQQKTNAEEEYNSVVVSCSGRHTISHDWLERVSILLKNMKEVGYPDNTYSLQHTAYQLLVANGACCLTEAVSIVNSKRFRTMMFIPESAPKYNRPTIPSVEKVILKFFPGYKMFILKRFTFAVDVETREVIYPLPPFCVPKNSRVLDKITILLLLSPNDGFGPGLVVLPHTILNNKLRKSLSIEPSLQDWGLSGHNSGGLTRTIVHDYLIQIALPWITSVKSQQWENYLLVDRWWAIDKLSIPTEYSGFHTFGLHQMYRTNNDPLDVFFNMTLQRLWGVLSRKWKSINGNLTEDMFPTFYIQSLKNIYSNSNIADFCAQTGLYPIDMNRAYNFTQQNFSY